MQPNKLNPRDASRSSRGCPGAGTQQACPWATPPPLRLRSHRKVASIETATHGAQKSGANDRFPPIAEIQTDGVDGPLTASECLNGGRRRSPRTGAIHEEITTIGIDIAKHVFQPRVDAAGEVVLCRRLRRSQVAAFFAAVPPCLVGMEACGTAHFWARKSAAFRHDARLMPPGYVKPYVKRNKHDAADAEAVCEAVRRPSMRFVPVKTPEQQAALSRAVSAISWFGSGRCSSMPCADTWPSSASSSSAAFTRSKN